MKVHQLIRFASNLVMGASQFILKENNEFVGNGNDGASENIGHYSYSTSSDANSIGFVGGSDNIINFSGRDEIQIEREVTYRNVHDTILFGIDYDAMLVVIDRNPDNDTSCGQSINTATSFTGWDQSNKDESEEDDWKGFYLNGDESEINEYFESLFVRRATW